MIEVMENWWERKQLDWVGLNWRPIFDASYFIIVMCFDKIKSEVAFLSFGMRTCNRRTNTRTTYFTELESQTTAQRSCVVVHSIATIIELHKSNISHQTIMSDISLEVGMTWWVSFFFTWSIFFSVSFANPCSCTTHTAPLHDIHISRYIYIYIYVYISLLTTPRILYIPFVNPQWRMRGSRQENPWEDGRSYKCSSWCRCKDCHCHSRRCYCWRDGAETCQMECCFGKICQDPLKAVRCILLHSIPWL